MQVRVSADAVDDLRSIRTYIGRDNPEAAQRLAGKILAACDTLSRFPLRGRAGSVSGTRELAVVSPYVIVYQLTDTAVVIVRIWHGAQDRAAPLP